MPQHPHHIIPPHIYPSIPIHHICLFPYCTSPTIYAPYLVPHYPHIPSSGYTHTSSISITSSMLPPNYSKMMSEHRRKRRNRRSNEQKNKIKDSPSIREGDNQYLISVYVDGSHEDKGQHK